MIWLQIRAGVIGFLNLVQIVLLVYCVLSWFMDRHSPVMRFLTRVTDPILQPLRGVLLRSTRSAAWAGFAPLVAVLLIQLLRAILLRL
ncbi:MAG: YggT family protein [Clostridia bacterium]|nr:YggT family protein [Clostridia bacterium]